MGLLSGPTVSVAWPVIVEPSEKSKCFVHTAIQSLFVAPFATTWQWPARLPVCLPLISVINVKQVEAIAAVAAEATGAAVPLEQRTLAASASNY